MTFNLKTCCKSVTGYGVAALVAAMLPGCSIENALPGYVDAPSAAVINAAPPDLVPQEAFAAELQASLDRRVSALAQTEALIARAARLRLWAQQ